MFVAGPDATGPRVMAAVAALQGRAAAGGMVGGAESWRGRHGAWRVTVSPAVASGPAAPPSPGLARAQPLRYRMGAVAGASLWASPVWRRPALAVRTAALIARDDPTRTASFFARVIAV